MNRRGSNTVFGMVLAGVVVGMLYRLFCAVTGYGGTPQIGLAAAPGAARHSITVRFNADTSPALPWRFLPEQKQMRLPLGEQQVAFYAARNQDSVPVTGIAVYNVTPDKIGKYFHKTACFCFTEQTLGPDQEMQFPVSFWVDPALADDPNTADVRTITLSYTFFRSLDDAARTGALAKAGPHVGPLTQ
jgi:cytochrome c oxidase assembly protein subunit 11